MSSVMNLNLLPSSAKFQASKVRLQKRVRFVMMCLASVWIVLVIIVFALNIFTKMMVNTATAKYKTANGNYLNMSNDIVTSQDLKYKAKMVAGVLAKRFEYGKSFEIIQGLFGSGIALEKYELGELGVFKVGGSMVGKENVDQLEKTIDDINAGRREGLSRAKLLGLSEQKDAWTFSMEVVIK